MSEPIKTPPLVSCITPFLNTEKFLAEAIDSLLAQTYKNWELVLIDDGSTDRSTEIALDYVKKYPESIYYLEHEGHKNLGLGVSRNLGIHNSYGKYIAFLDADDIWLPEKLEMQLAILEANPDAGMVFGAHNRWFSWSGKPEDALLDEEFPPLWGSDIKPDTLVQPPKFFVDYLKKKVGTPLTCGVLIKREVIDEVGGFDKEVSFLNEDGPFFAKIFFKAPVFLESGCWDRYRQHPHSTTAIARDKGELIDGDVPQPVHLAELTILERFLQEQGNTDPIIKKALKDQLFPYRHPYLYQSLQILKKLAYRLQTTLTKLVGN